MIDLAEILSYTKETRVRIWDVWDRIRKGKAKPNEARMEIAAANAMLSAHKVALTAVHLLESPIPKPPVSPEMREAGAAVLQAWCAWRRREDR